MSLKEMHLEFCFRNEKKLVRKKKVKFHQVIVVGMRNDRKRLLPFVVTVASGLWVRAVALVVSAVTVSAVVVVVVVAVVTVTGVVRSWVVVAVAVRVGRRRVFVVALVVSTVVVVTVTAARVLAVAAVVAVSVAASVAGRVSAVVCGRVAAV